jgi:hypothetical protein
MKRIFFSAFVFCSLTIAAQQRPDLRNQNKNTIPGKPLYRNNLNDSLLKKFLKMPGMPDYLNPDSKLLYTLSNGSKVYILPLDNMPCLVPELAQFNMPVMGRDMKMTGMPPGLQPPVPLIPPQNK